MADLASSSAGNIYDPRLLPRERWIRAAEADAQEFDAARKRNNPNWDFPQRLRNARRVTFNELGMPELHPIGDPEIRIGTGGKDNFKGKNFLNFPLNHRFGV